MEKREICLKLCFLLAFLLILADLAYFSESPKITGMASNEGQIFIYVEGCIGQNIDFLEGWNFNSFYLIFPNYSVSDILSPINGDYEYILEWNSSGQQFNIWSKNGLKEFTEFNSNKSYFIFVDNPQNFIVCGDLFNNVTIDLLSGWEAVNYPYSYASNVSGSSFYNTTFDYFLKWNNSVQEFMVYSPLSSNPGFNNINASEGYFIRTQGGALKYIRNASL
jgi:hypothetical protein